MSNWEEQLKIFKTGVFEDEMRYASNKILALPIEDQPSEAEILEFLNECLIKDFKKIFIRWDKLKPNN